MSPRVPCRVSKFGLLCAGLLATLSVPAWSLDDKAPPTADNSNNPFASSDISSDAALTPASSGAAATGTSGDPTTATAGAAVDSDPATGSGLQGGARSNAATGLAPSDPMGTSTDADRIEHLERQLESLLNEIRSLRGERNDDGRPTPAQGTVEAGWIGPPAFSPDGKLIAVATRDGRIAIVEVGTGKEVWRIELDAATGKPLIMGFDQNGSVLSVASANGQITAYDTATGKRISISGTAAGGAVAGIYFDSDTAKDLSRIRPTMVGLPAFHRPAQDPAASSTDPTLPSPARSSLFAGADTAESSAGSLAQSLAGAQIDLIRLSTEYVEAVGAKKLAERHLSRMQGLDKANAIPEEQVVTAEVNYETASNKVALLRAIAEAAAEATKGELEFAERMAEKGYASSASVTQLKAKLRIISLILDGGAHN